ncbi:hypothetical protein J6590_102021 [Homalodisca vitripennis]|nr:hypothetical protein J6590_102021 [Homalodisca vitripennis]
MIKIIKKKLSRSPVNETTVRRLLEQEESEDEMLSAIDDTDSDPDYGPSSFRDQLHTPDLKKCRKRLFREDCYKAPKVREMYVGQDIKGQKGSEP